MSIVIKTEELNYLIYTYFLEQGFAHSAFTLYNEVKLDSAKYNEEVKPGQLINLLEKALLFQQLQDHIQMNQYIECKVPTYLISKHICTFTEKKQQAEKQEKRDKELIIQNALMRSQEFIGCNGATIDQEIELQQPIDLGEEITLLDWNPFKNMLAIYHQSINCVKFVQNMQTICIMPAIIGESFHKVRMMKFDKASGNYLFLVFENGVALVTDTACQLIKMFNIKNAHRLIDFQWNLNWPNILSLIFDKYIEIIDVFKCQTLKMLDNCQYFEWRFFDQFILMDNNYYINLHHIDQEKPIIQLKAELETTLIEFNKSKTLLATFSSTLNSIKVWTLLNEEYVFEITDDLKILNFCWCSSQNANYLITLTTSVLNIWDVEFGQIKCNYEIDYPVLNMISMDLLAETPQVILFAAEKKVIIYDLINRKRRILSLLELPSKILRTSEDEVLLLFHHSLCLLNIKKY